MRILHPIQTWRSMRRRSKVLAGGVGGLLIVPLVAFAAMLLVSSTPFTGNGVHNASWSVSLTAATEDTTDSTIYLPTDSPQTAADALGCTDASACSIPSDASQNYVTGAAVFSAASGSNPAEFNLPAGIGAVPGDVSYTKLTFNVPATNAVDTYITGLDLTGLPTGWVAFLDGTQGGNSVCGKQVGTAGTANPSITEYLAIVAGDNSDMSDTTNHQITGHLTFGGSRSSVTGITANNCTVIGQ